MGRSREPRAQSLITVINLLRPADVAATNIIATENDIAELEATGIESL